MVKWFPLDYLGEDSVYAIDLHAHEIPSREISHIPDWGVREWLFDFNNPVVRRLSLRRLDNTAESREEWERFLRTQPTVDEVILLDDRLPLHSVAARRYSEFTKKGYIRLFEKAGIQTRISAMPAK